MNDNLYWRHQVENMVSDPDEVINENVRSTKDEITARLANDLKVLIDVAVSDEVPYKELMIIVDGAYCCALKAKYGTLWKAAKYSTGHNRQTMSKRINAVHAWGVNW